MTAETILGGFALGLMQGFGGFDHAACILPLLSKETGSNISVAVAWSLAHSAGVLILSVLLFFLKAKTGLALMERLADSLFGITLVIIGGMSLFKLLPEKAHTHSHCCSHHKDSCDESIEPLIEPSVPVSGSIVKAMSLGILHGVSGCSCAIAVLPALGISSISALSRYALAFGGGAVVGSVCFALLVGWLMSRRVQFLGGLLSVVVGTYWIAHVLRHH